MATVVTAMKKNETTNLIKIGNLFYIHQKKPHANTIRIAITKTQNDKTKYLYF